MDVVHLAITILSLILTAHFVLFAKVSLTFEFRLDYFVKPMNGSTVPLSSSFQHKSHIIHQYHLSRL